MGVCAQSSGTTVSSVPPFLRPVSSALTSAPLPPENDGTQPHFCGHNGQTVTCDVPSATVPVQTAVSEEGAWQPELLAIMQAAVNRR